MRNVLLREDEHARATPQSRIQIDRRGTIATAIAVPPFADIFVFLRDAHGSYRHAPTVETTKPLHAICV
jgi:hypothetical protein